MFLSMISIDSSVTIHYILEENTFVTTVYTLSLHGKKWLRCLKERKIKPPFLIYKNFEKYSSAWR